MRKSKDGSWSNLDTIIFICGSLAGFGFFHFLIMCLGGGFFLIFFGLRLLSAHCIGHITRGSFKDTGNQYKIADKDSSL